MNPCVAARGLSILVWGFILSAGANAQTIMHESYGCSAYDEFGIAVSDAGYVNDDPYPDVIVGAQQMHDNGPGYARVLSGEFMKTCSGRKILLTLYPVTAEPRNFGHSVSGAGDVNKDGHADLIVGDIDANGAVGSATVFSGLDGTELRTFLGDTPGDYLGYSVSDAGDVNHDTYPDVIVGAPQWVWDHGYARVYSGKFIAEGIGPELLHEFQGTTSGGGFGESVSGAGYVDDDPYADLIVGAGGPSAAAPGGPGYVQVFSGLTGEVLPYGTFYGDQPGDLLGKSVSDAGDLNGDTFPDVIVGASQLGQELAGQAPGYARVLSGKFIVTGVGSETLYDDLDGASLGSGFGHSVSGVCDVNGDAVPDLIVGAPWDDDPSGVLDTGSTRVFSGADGTELFTFYGNPATCQGSRFGHSVSNAGDITRDGFCEVIVGAYCDQTNPSAGCCSGMPRVYDLNAEPGDLPPECMPDCNGNTTPDECDIAQGTSTDFNGNGIPDVCEGIPTVSEWGVVAMALLVLTAGTLVLRWRRAAQT